VLQERRLLNERLVRLREKVVLLDLVRLDWLPNFSLVALHIGAFETLSLRLRYAQSRVLLHLLLLLLLGDLLIVHTTELLRGALDEGVRLQTVHVLRLIGHLVCQGLLPHATFLCLVLHLLLVGVMLSACKLIEGKFVCVYVSAGAMSVFNLRSCGAGLDHVFRGVGNGRNLVTRRLDHIRFCLLVLQAVTCHLVLLLKMLVSRHILNRFYLLLVESMLLPKQLLLLLLLLLHLHLHLYLLLLAGVEGPLMLGIRIYCVARLLLLLLLLLGWCFLASFEVA